MKLLVVLLLLSFQVQAQSINDKMEQRTLEAIAKFYEVDIIVDETSRRIQEKYLPEYAKPYIPYFGTMLVLIREQKFVYRSSF